MVERSFEHSGLMGAILASARVRAAAITPRVAAELGRRASTRRPAGLAFVAALSDTARCNVIAECKRQSPLNGVLRDRYDAAGIALAYERAGAAAVSVLTEPEFFGGSLDDLHAVRQHVALPVLRKDFIVDERQLIEARAAGADAVLLIVAALPGAALGRLLRAAHDLELAALVEVHDETDLERALNVGARVIGVNARDLRTMKVEPETSERLAAMMPRCVVRVAESGINSRGAIDRLRAAGYQAFLVGERLIASERPEVALAELLGQVPPCS